MSGQAWPFGPPREEESAAAIDPEFFRRAVARDGLGLARLRVAVLGAVVTLLLALECDDGNADDSDACIGTCKLAKCGDGFIRTDIEDCDDSNTKAGDGCSPTCKFE